MKRAAALAGAAWTILASCAATASPVWRPAANLMRDGRWAPAACVLPGGRTAIVAGGYSYAAKRCVASIDLFDERTDRFAASKARLAYPADFVEAAPLPDGDILLAGGFSDIWASLDIAQVYDPRTDTCRLTSGRMTQHRELFQTTVLPDGTVLLTGGLDLWVGATVRTAEIYHPATQQFTRTAGDMIQDRFGHAACALADGRVLIVGGTSWNLRTHHVAVLNTAEIYDPRTGTFALTRGKLDVPRDRPTATLLPSGRVLIFGGQGPDGAPVTTAEIFDPATGLFHVIPGAPLQPRMAHQAVLCPARGCVVIAGGWDSQQKRTIATALAFDWRTVAFAPLPDLPFAAHDEAMVAFPDGGVMVAGGKIAVGAQASSNDRGALMPPP